jgi:hypothetical protein
MIRKPYLPTPWQLNLHCASPANTNNISDKNPQVLTKQAGVSLMIKFKIKLNFLFEQTYHASPANALQGNKQKSTLALAS